MKYAPLTIPDELAERVRTHFTRHRHPSVDFIVALMVREYLDDFDREERERNEAPPPGAV